MASAEEALKAAANCLDEAVEQILIAFRAVPVPPGHYEAELEAELMITMSIRHAEGVATLAREGIVMYPAAMVLARAAYEGGIRVLWMLKPDDPFDRESRWLANLGQTARFHEQLSHEFESLGFEDRVVDDERDVAATIRSFAQGVTDKLPERIEPIPKVPPLREMVRELDIPERYVAYRLGSQFTHVAGYAIGIYRRNLGTAVDLGEFLEPSQWIAPLHMTWWSLWMPTARLLSLLQGDVEAFKASLPVRAIEKAVESLAASSIAGGSR
jgi:hypothetical protein